MEEVMKINQIIKERESTHGDFEMKAIFVQEIMENITGLYSWEKMSADQKKRLIKIICVVAVPAATSIRRSR
jgi:hypothetical protein